MLVNNKHLIYSGKNAHAEKPLRLHKVADEKEAFSKYGKIGKNNRKRIPKGCVYPDCFHCPLPDCMVSVYFPDEIRRNYYYGEMKGFKSHYKRKEQKKKREL